MPQATAHALPDDALTQLLSQAHRPDGLAYAGDIGAKDSYEYLTQHPAILVDVRTPQEWQNGIPDLSKTQNRLLLNSWKTAPDYALNPDFAAQIAKEIPNKHIPVFFICHSGGRSLDAAIAMTAAGYDYCFNIKNGFEGQPHQSRSTAQSWKAAQLPSKQG